MRNIILFITILSFSSCASYKPDSKGVGQKDYNGRLWIDNAHYNKRTTVMGYGTMVAAAAAGGYAAYEYGDGIVTYYDEGERKNLKAADAAIGALTAFTVTYIANKLISKPTNIKTDINPQEWMKDARIDDEYNILKANSNDLTLIDKSYESRFTVRNYKDVKDFENAFPNSRYLDDILKKATTEVSRSELYSLIKKYPTARDIKSMQLEYIRSSPSLAAFYKSYYEFPNNGFSNKTTYVNRLVKKASRGDLPSIISTYPSDNDIDILKEEYFDDSSTLLDLYKAQRKYKNYIYTDFDNKVKSLLPSADRYTLKDIVKNFPHDKNFPKIKTSYIDKSSNLSELLEAKQLFSSVSYDYDKKALSLLNKLEELSIYKKIVSKNAYIIGQRKVDDKMWQSASSKNSFNSYNYYLKNAPLKLHLSAANNAKQTLVRLEEERKEKERLAEIKRNRLNRESIEKYGYPTIKSVHKYKARLVFPTEIVTFDDGIKASYRTTGPTGYYISHGFLGTGPKRLYHSLEDVRYGAYCLEKYNAYCSDDQGYYEQSYSADNNYYDDNISEQKDAPSSQRENNDCSKSSIDNGLHIPSYKEGKSNYNDSWYYLTKDIRFNDGTKGRIFQKEDGRWYLSAGNGIDYYYYNSKQATIYALYFSKKCNYATKKDKN